MEKKTYKQVLFETLEKIVECDDDNPAFYHLASFCMSMSAVIMHTYIIMHTYNCESMGKFNFDIDEYGKSLTSHALPKMLWRANIENFMNWLLNTEADISGGGKWSQLPEIAEIFNQFGTGKREV